MMNEELSFKLKNLPDIPGVYLFKNKENEIIYIGKAKSLKKRIVSYWKERNPKEDPIYNNKIRKLVSLIFDIDLFVLENEVESLILENELIKKHQPRFNALAKDDKSYPWVRITNEKYPRVSIIRDPERHGTQHKYIGPFVDAGDLRRLIKFIRKIFPYCTCKKNSTRNKRVRPCIYYQINLCPAPCCMKVDQKEYIENINNIEQMLIGNIESIQKSMQTKMEDASEKLKFEEAAVWRDRLDALEIFTIEQSIISYDLENNKKKKHDDEDIAKPVWKDFDIVAGFYSKERAGIIILHVRHGRLIGKTPYVINLGEKIVTNSNYFLSLFKQHYLRPEIPVPNEIISKNEIPKDIIKGLSTYFSKKKNSKKVIFRKPSENDKTAGLLRIASKNIELLVNQKDQFDVHKGITKGLQNLKEILNLDEIPLIIEAFDMSHTQGTDYVGSMVCFVEGKPSKSHYRRFKVKSTQKPDDIAAMKEVMTRRYTRAIKNDNLPDLIVVDGGKGQINMAHNLLRDLGIENIPHIGLSKPEGRSEINKPPKIIIPELKGYIELPLKSESLHILQALRDESHRFAINYHRLLRKKRQKKSELDDISGIGPARKRKLLTFFGSVKEIRKASEERIADVVGSSLAKVIFEYFKQKSEKISRKKKTSRKEAVSSFSKQKK
jgi:excinuclease ABC subunit C